jgi:PhnB protein
MAGGFAPVPEGYHTITPYICVNGCDEAMKFYAKAFGAVELTRIVMDNDRIGFAEMQIGDSRLMLADEFPEINVVSPERQEGSSVTLHLYVEDVDAWTERALAAGATLVRPAADQTPELRNAIVRCPYHHRWMLSSRLAGA